ncbi:MAG: nucleotide exchange factor GrpE [Candidatus Omnitrophica bacterium]|jgi:molecular chaperone GrpE|nr:nucleotide exchange factor GrpE [Candidatus Omnitrophota bacterium]MDD5080320.1 nucleotide exchange factor GrpE [Candidatus Omnitrophota bacterium]
MENKKNHESQKKNDVQPQPGECAEKIIEVNEAEFNRLKEEAAKAQENWDKFLRLQADFENTRKRWERDRLELLRYANDDLLCSLLNITDDLERSLELSQGKHEDFTAFMKGVEMILAHIHDLMKKNGVAAIDASGKIFDPNFHEALMQVESGDWPENTVVEELQKGYLLNGKVLRTAKVKVSKNPAAKEKEENKK